MFTFETLGEVHVARRLEGIAARGSDLRLVFAEIAKKMMEIEKKQFDSEGAARSGGWAPLAENTINKKVRAGQPLTILEATGDLKDSLATFGGRGQHLIIDNEFLLYGTGVEYAIYHQKSTKNMPQRRVIEFSEADKVEFVKMLQYFLITGNLKSSAFLL